MLKKVINLQLLAAIFPFVVSYRKSSTIICWLKKNKNHAQVQNFLFFSSTELFNVDKLAICNY